MSVFEYPEPGEETELNIDDIDTSGHDDTHLLSLIDNSTKSQENYRVTVPVSIVREFDLSPGDPLVVQKASSDELLIKVI